jgi:hypothetical protein
MMTGNGQNTLSHSPRILPDPNRKAHRRLVLAMAFLYILGLVAPGFHHHDLGIRSVADASVAAHTCGDVERHVPLDAFHECQVCWQASQRLSLPAVTDTPGVASAVTGDVPEYRLIRTPSAAPLLPDKRGPPAVA